jgi:hypothetical protein
MIGSSHPSLAGVYVGFDDTSGTYSEDDYGSAGGEYQDCAGDRECL